MKYLHIIISTFPFLGWGISHIEKVSPEIQTCALLVGICSGIISIVANIIKWKDDD